MDKKSILKINQSKIKRLASSLLCPKRYYLEEITGELVRHSSTAMLYGNYFEYHATGQIPRDGVIPVIPKLSKKRAGSYVPAAQQRIDAQIKKFHEVLAGYGIRIIQTGYEITYIFNTDIEIVGITDCLVDFGGLPYILDIKLTADVNNDFGDFAWGEFQTPHFKHKGMYVTRFIPGSEGMDLIQSEAYMYGMEKITKKRWGFLYAVFDHKPKSEHKIIEVISTDEGRNDFLTRLSETKDKLHSFKQLNYEPIPSYQECKSCKNMACGVRYDFEAMESAQYNEKPEVKFFEPVQDQELIWQDGN